MRRKQSVGLADVFGSVVSQLERDRSQINAVDANGNHGDNALHNFQIIASALKRADTQDAGVQLRRAADALQQDGRGSSANLYTEGLLEAAQQLQGKDGIGLDDILPFLQGLLGGVQHRTNAQSGQGTLLDTLIPAISSYASARSSGRSNSSAISEALNVAMRGSQQTFNQSARYGNINTQAALPRRDPGAVSANSLLEGLLGSLSNL